jgi:hypothetical protein
VRCRVRDMGITFEDCSKVVYWVGDIEGFVNGCWLSKFA